MIPTCLLRSDDMTMIWLASMQNNIRDEVSMDSASMRLVGMSPKRIVLATLLELKDSLVMTPRNIVRAVTLMGIFSGVAVLGSWPDGGIMVWLEFQGALR